MSEFGRMMDEKDNEIATLKARVAELENALKWEEKGGQAFDNCLAILIDRTAERDKLAEQVRTLRAGLEIVLRAMKVSMYYEESYRLQRFVELNERFTPLLAGEPE